MGGARAEVALLGLLWASAVSARAPILCVGPLLPRIIEDLALSYTAAGFLFALPLLIMGCLSVPGGLVADRLGAACVIRAALLTITVASALRAAGSAWALFLGTALLGATIGVMQPSLPRVVRERFPDHVGTGTAAYSLGLNSGAFLGVSLTPWLAPLAHGWHGAFLVWSAVSLLPVLGWGPYVAAGRSREATQAPFDLPAFRAVLGDWLLWRIAIFQMLNSATFFAASAWLPAYYESLGWSPAQAAWPLALLTALGAIVGSIVPIVSDRLRARRGLLLGSCAAAVAGMVGFLAAPVTLAWPSSLVFGIGLVGSFTLNLALSVDASPPARVGAATGLVFSVGHGGALAGPLVVGLLRDVTGRYEAGIFALLMFVVAMTAFGISIPETYNTARHRRAR